MEGGGGEGRGIIGTVPPSGEDQWCKVGVVMEGGGGKGRGIIGTVPPSGEDQYKHRDSAAG